jgi:hypothetical protein
MLNHRSFRLWAQSLDACMPPYLLTSLSPQSSRFSGTRAERGRIPWGVGTLVGQMYRQGRWNSSDEEEDFFIPFSLILRPTPQSSRFNSPIRRKLR